MTWPLHQMTWHDMTCHAATNHSSSPHVTSQPTTLLHLTPQATSWHQNRSHYHRGTAETSFTAKKWFGHGAGRSPCAHSIGKFFLCYIFFFFWNFRPRLARELLVYVILKATSAAWLWSTECAGYNYPSKTLQRFTPSHRSWNGCCISRHRSAVHLFWQKS